MKYERKKAIALKYDQAKQLPPKVTASGQGIIAEEIIAKAKEYEVPIVEDASLAALLAELNINETIPEELFEAVAEVFAFIYRLDQQAYQVHKRNK